MNAEERHEGDFGNIVADNQGVAKISVVRYTHNQLFILDPYEVEGQLTSSSEPFYCHYYRLSFILAHPPRQGSNLADLINRWENLSYVLSCSLLISLISSFYALYLPQIYHAQIAHQLISC